MTDITRDPRLQSAADCFRIYAKAKSLHKKIQAATSATWSSARPFPKDVLRELQLLSMGMERAKDEGFAAKPKHVRSATMVKLLRAIEKESTP